MMFSATWSSQIQALATLLRPGAVRIQVAGVPPSITQQVEMLPKAARAKRLRELLRNFEAGTKVLLFAVFKKEAKELGKMLPGEGVQAFVLEGGMSQAARARSMQGFRDSGTGAATANSKCVVLVATDVASRGLDIPDVSHVVNFSFGLSAEGYVHRIGRCGRAGRRGLAITFVTDGDERFAPYLIQVLRQAKQPVPENLAQMADMY